MSSQRAAERVAAARAAVDAAERARQTAQQELWQAMDALKAEAVASGEGFLCPRRAEGGVASTFSGVDTWAPGHGLVTQATGCSYCGSMAPDDFMAAVRAGKKIGPTDKSYKAYVDGHSGKFYYQHLSVDQQREFADLQNAKRITWDEPGYPYVPPFFMGRNA